MGKKIFWDVTDRCNLNCLHCSNTIHYNYFSPSKLRKVNIANAIEIIDKLADAGVSSVHFLGGEPLLRKDIFNLLDYAAKKIPKVILITNGILVNEEKAKRIILSGISRVGISLDGPTKESFEFIRGKGLFERVLRNIKYLIKWKKILGAPTSVSIEATLMKTNLKLIPDFIALAKELEVDSLSFQTLSISGNAKNNIDLIGYSNYEFLDAILKNAKLLSEYSKSSSKPLVRLFGLRFTYRDYIKEKYGFELQGEAYACGGGMSYGYIRSDEDYSLVEG